MSAPERAGPLAARGLVLVPIGPLPDGLLDHLGDFLGRSLAGPVRRAGAALDPGPAFDPSRRQYNCRVLLPALERNAAPGEKVLGVADVDLFSPIFTFVFGEAHLGGTAGLFSIARLRNTYYGLPDDPGLLLARARTEALHETGHLMGLLHCRALECAMRSSAAAEEIDLKPDRLCADCGTRMRYELDWPAR